MTTYYLDSAAGSATSPYDTWAKAATTLASIISVMSAGDVIYVASTHSESAGATTTYLFPGTNASQNAVVCADKTSGAPPTTIATGAQIGTTGAFNLTLKGCLYCYGVTWQPGSGSAGNLTLTLAGNSGDAQTHESCTYYLQNTGSASAIQLGVQGSITAQLRLVNPTFKFSATGQGLAPGSGDLDIIGGSVDGSGSAISTLFRAMTNACNVSLDGFDASNMAASGNLFAVPSAVFAGCLAIARYCRLPSSGALSGNPLGYGARLEMRNCSDGTDWYRSGVNEYVAIMTTTTSTFRSGGAKYDGTNGFAWLVQTTLNAEYPAMVFITPTIAQLQTNASGTHTATVEISGPSGLTDKDVWLEFYSMDSSATPLATITRTKTANYLQSGNALTTSAATWTSGGTNNYKLVATFSPAIAGPINARVFVARNLLTVYIDPKITVS